MDRVPQGVLRAGSNLWQEQEGSAGLFSDDFMLYVSVHSKLMGRTADTKSSSSRLLHQWTLVP